MHHTYTALASIDILPTNILAFFSFQPVTTIVGAYALRVNICLYPERRKWLVLIYHEAKVVIIDFQLQFFVAKQLVLGWLTTDWSRLLLCE